MKQETGCDPCDRPSITSVVGEPVYTDGLSQEQVRSSVPTHGALCGSRLTLLIGGYNKSQEGILMS